MLLSFLVFSSVFSACLAVKLYRSYRLQKRELLHQIRNQFSSREHAENWLARLARRFDRSSPGINLHKKLRQLHLPLQPSDYVAYYVLAIVVLTCLLCSLLGFTFWPAFLSAGISLELFTRIFARTRKNKHILLLNKQLPDVCLLLANALRAGLTVTQAFELLAQDAAAPARTEFLQMSGELELGAEFENVLTSFQHRTRSADIDLFAAVVVNQRKIGGNLVQVLEHMTKTLQDRRLMQEEIKTMTAEAKYVSNILPLVPAVLLLMMNSMIDGFLQPLLTLPGLLLLAAFIGVQAAAVAAVRKIAAVKV